LLPNRRIGKLAPFPSTTHHSSLSGGYLSFDSLASICLTWPPLHPAAKSPAGPPIPLVQLHFAVGELVLWPPSLSPPSVKHLASSRTSRLLGASAHYQVRHLSRYFCDSPSLSVLSKCSIRDYIVSHIISSLIRAQCSLLLTFTRRAWPGDGIF